MIRVVLAGGGTGGHLFPGIAVAQELRARDPEGDIFFMCTERPFDREQLQRYNFDFQEQQTPRTPRKKWQWPGVLFRLWRARSRAIRLLKERKAQVVIGLGGYGSLPVILAAKKLKLPIYLLEQNTVPGRANRVAARWATRVLTQWKESVSRFENQDRVEVTGNPVRLDLLPEDQGEARGACGLQPNRKTVLVFGASQGAHSINQILTENIDLLKTHAELQLIHITGKSDASWVKELYAKAGLSDRVSVYPFVEQMQHVYSAADLVVARAGGTSIAELSSFGCPAVLIPYPHHADQHQRFNATAVQDAGAGLLVEEDTLDRAKLSEIYDLAEHGNGELTRMREAMKQLNRIDARARVADLVMEHGG